MARLELRSILPSAQNPTRYLVLTLPRPDVDATRMLDEHAAEGWRVIGVAGGDRTVTVVLERTNQ